MLVGHQYSLTRQPPLSHFASFSFALAPIGVRFLCLEGGDQDAALYSGWEHCLGV